MDSPAAIDPTRSSQNLTREAWVEMQLVQIFMRHAQPVQYVAAAMLITVVAVLYRHVEPAGLWAWAVAVVAVTLTRSLVIHRYQRTMVGVSGLALSAFMARYIWIWPLSAMIWGSSIVAFFLKAPIYGQFVCMLVLVGMAGLAIGALSSCPRCFYGYVDGLNLSALAALIYQLLMERGIPSTFNTYGMVALVLTYWLVIRVSGRRVHEAQRANLRLQFDNLKLIASLTEKSCAEQEAAKVKSRFIASAAHDLRQPVHALALYAGWLVAEPQFVAQIAPKIVQATKAVNELFNSLFDLAGLDSDPSRVNPQLLDLGRLVQEIEVQYAPVARERGLRLRATLNKPRQRSHTGQ